MSQVYQVKPGDTLASIDYQQYPEVTKLLTHHSELTPSMRVEQAAVWAEQHVTSIRKLAI